MAVKPIRLSNRDQRALRDFVVYLQQTVPDQLECVALFGSKARGDNKRGSDIDVLVILSREDRELRRKILRQSARISLNYDVILSLRVIGAERWEKMHGFSLYQNIKREAVDLRILGEELVLETL